MYRRINILQVPFLLLLHLTGNDAAAHLALHCYFSAGGIALLYRVRAETSHPNGGEAQGAARSVEGCREVVGRQDGPTTVGDCEKSNETRNERRDRCYEK